MQFGRTNVNKFLIEEQRRNPALAGDFSMLISDVVRSCKAISQVISRGALAGFADDPGHRTRTTTSWPRRRIWPIRRSSTTAWGGHLTALTSSEAADISRFRTKACAAVPAGFRPARRGAEHRRQCHRRQHLLRARLPRRRQRTDGGRLSATGIAPAGRRLRTVRSVDNAGADGRQRHTRLHAGPRDRRILLTHPDMRIPPETSSFAINTSNGRFWSRRSAATSMSAWKAEPAFAPGFQHALGRINGRRRASHSGARRCLHVPARHARSLKKPGRLHSCIRSARWR